MKTRFTSLVFAVAVAIGLCVSSAREAAAQFFPPSFQAVVKSIRCVDMQDEGTRFDNIYVLTTADGQQTKKLRHQTFSVGTRNNYNETINFTSEAVIQVVEDDQGLANFGRGGDDFFEPLTISADLVGRGPQTFTVQHQDPDLGDLGIYEVVVEVFGQGPPPGPAPSPFPPAPIPAPIASPSTTQLVGSFWHEARVGQMLVYKLDRAGFNQLTCTVTTLQNGRVVAVSPPQACQYDRNTGMLQLGNEGTFQVTFSQVGGQSGLKLTAFRGNARLWN